MIFEMVTRSEPVPHYNQFRAQGEELAVTPCDLMGNGKQILITAL